MRGTLFYLIGASGSGKDSLLEGCRRQLPAHLRCCIAHRYITRGANIGGENHIHLSQEEFRIREELGLFAMNWYSHGYHYGIGSEINLWLDSGANVVINGSREYLPNAMTLYDELIPVLVNVDSHRLRQRLINRDRESRKEIEARLERHHRMMATLPKDTQHVSNNGALEDGVQALLAIVATHSRQPA